MPLWGTTDNDASEPKGLAGGEFQGTAGKAIYGVDVTETGVARGNTVGGKAGAYSVAHAGWVGIHTYVDAHGNFRVKSETLVAFSSLSGDQSDDARFADS